MKNFLARPAYSHGYKRIPKQDDPTIRRYLGDGSWNSALAPKTVIIISSRAHAAASPWAKQGPPGSQRLPYIDALPRYGCPSEPVNDNIMLSRCAKLRVPASRNSATKYLAVAVAICDNLEQTVQSTNKHHEATEIKLRVVAPIPDTRHLCCQYTMSPTMTSTTRHSAEQSKNSMTTRGHIVELRPRRYFPASQQVTPDLVKEISTSLRHRDNSLIRQKDRTDPVNSARDYDSTEVANAALYDASTLRHTSLRTTIRPPCDQIKPLTNTDTLLASRHLCLPICKLRACNCFKLKQQLELSSASGIRASYLVQPSGSRNSASTTKPIGAIARYTLNSAQWKTCDDQLLNGRRRHEVLASVGIKTLAFA